MVSAIRQILVPQATVLMLSPAELGRMAETWREGGNDGMLEQDVAELTGSGCEFVLITGSRVGGGSCSNTLYDAEGVVASAEWSHLPGSFVGAGSTLSAALTALMARGASAPEALKGAQDYTSGALAHAQRLGMGKLVPNKFFQSAAPAPTAAD
jgi:hydroxymethylpyrimidine/phosphomethylpyrimidine kinase